MYKLTVYNLDRKMISEDYLWEYPSRAFIDQRTAQLRECFIDICRVPSGTGLDMRVELDDKLTYELEKLNESIR